MHHKCSMLCHAFLCVLKATSAVHSKICAAQIVGGKRVKLGVSRIEMRRGEGLWKL